MPKSSKSLPALRMRRHRVRSNESKCLCSDKRRIELMSAAMDPDHSPEENPLLAPWAGPFQAPPFERIKPNHFVEAFETAFSVAQAEIHAIAANPEPPSVENTIVALERSGRLLTRISSVFFNLATAATNDAIQAIEREVAPKLARHRSALYLNEALFRRVDALHKRREELGLEAEQAQLLHRYHVGFSRNGGGLADGPKARLAEVAERLAGLGTNFSQNVLADEKDYVLFLPAKEDLAGLPKPVISAAAQAAA